MKRRGFTLVELLVVIAIIVALLAILLPSMNRAIRVSHRAVCASNLHQWGVSLLTYAADSYGVLPETNLWWGARYPNFWRATNAMGPQYITYEKVAAYLPGVNDKDRTISKIWTCPANDIDWGELVKADWDGFGAINTQYAYFAGVNLWSSLASYPNELTESRVGGSRVLMTDTLYVWHVTGGWDYNHEQYGSSLHKSGTGARVETGVPTFEGINRLDAGGAVMWKGRVDFNPAAMNALAATERYVLGAVNDRTFY